MRAVAVDASVWIAAQDQADPFCKQSRLFFSHAVNPALLAKALMLGTTRFLRGADAMYSATAEIAGCALVSWDKEHLQRAGAQTPEKWLAANPLP